MTVLVAENELALGVVFVDADSGHAIDGDVRCDEFTVCVFPVCIVWVPIHSQ